MRKCYAYSIDGDDNSNQQSLDEHLFNVAELKGIFTSVFTGNNWKIVRVCFMTPVRQPRNTKIVRFGVIVFVVVNRLRMVSRGRK